MKKLIMTKSAAYACLFTLMTLSGCSMFDLDLQKNYDYEHQTLDPHINISARQFLESRSYETQNNPSDTVFKWMRKGLEYAGISLEEFEKPGRTFIFLHNEGIRVWDAKKNKVTAGLFFDFPIVTGEDPETGQPITRPATMWEDYDKEDVKNYFLYLIVQGTYNFEDLTITNTTAQTLLPSGAIATKKSLLGYMNEGKGFDQEGKMNFKIVNNNDLAPIQINDKTNDRSGGYIATNGIVHVFGAKGAYTVYPFRAPL